MTAALAPDGDLVAPIGPGLRDLARLGVSLRWRLVTNRARRAATRVRWFAYGMAFLYALGNLYLLSSVRWARGDGPVGDVLLFLVTSMASGWIFGPILVGGVDETVDPTRLALLPLRARDLFVVQVAAALSGVGPLGATFSLVVGTTIGFAPLGPGFVVPGLAAVLTIVIIVGCARTVAALLTIAQRTRLGRDLSVILAALSAGALFVVGQLATTSQYGLGLMDVLRKAPWAWPVRAIIAVHQGDGAAAVAWLAAGSVAAVAALAAWSALSQFLLRNGERVVRTGRRARGAALNRATSVFGAALSRQWIYLRRAPKARVSLAFGIAFGVAFPVLQLLQHGGGDAALAPFSILLAMLANVGATSNLIGFDAASLWMEVLAGGPGRVHMTARSAMALPNLLLPTWLSAVVVGTWTGRWADIAVVAALAIPIALLVAAQGMVTSVLAPWPLSDGDNPFGNRQASEGRGSKLAFIALSGLASALVFAAPLIVAAYIGRDAWWVWLVPIVGMAWAMLWCITVISWLGNRLAGSEPELVERLSPLAVNG